VFEMMQHSVPHLKTAGKDAGPSILNVSSVNGAAGVLLLAALL
jgi:NAD(P)-dependent dehydrogenase (short-subunit alcohol dehydrogenase family)